MKRSSEVLPSRESSRLSIRRIVRPTIHNYISFIYKKGKRNLVLFRTNFLPRSSLNLLQEEERY